MAEDSAPTPVPPPSPSQAQPTALPPPNPPIATAQHLANHLERGANPDIAKPAIPSMNKLANRIELDEPRSGKPLTGDNPPSKKG